MVYAKPIEEKSVFKEDVEDGRTREDFGRDSGDAEDMNDMIVGIEIIDFCEE